MARRVCIGICAVLAVGMFAPGTASAARADAKVIINSYDPPPIIGTWAGKVKSERKACKKNREIILYRRAGKDNEEVGSDTTARVGNHWVWSVPAAEVEGDYFALAPPTPKCKREESKIFNYPDDNPPLRPY